MNDDLHFIAITPEKRVETPSDEPAKKGWLSRLTDGLKRSSNSITQGVVSLVTKKKLDGEALEELEDILIQADLGVDTAMAITTRLEDERFGKEVSEEEIKQVLADEVAKVLEPVAEPLRVAPTRKPHVILMVGVNGAGKTTTIGKLASKISAFGMKPMLAAGDTFRAAAIEQLKVWGERTGAPVITRPQGSDAAGLAFDALTQAKEQDIDVLLIDTAGRLQNRTELMAELEKVIRVIKKIDPDAPHDVLLTLDATTGQNALNQVDVFGKTAGVTGLVMTKLDGTAKGGILVAIAKKHQIPVHLIGVGEAVDDLEAFDPTSFARAIAGLDDTQENEPA
ncbi:MAG: signal recognition particle-docking protein FtsY [Rhizobiales bacterium]|nr:signal recognition particle-docking protein FtsY [Hyphomicrobiales bacterium]MBO6699842.1 signal recognition particle-docking protein FtsY [Hyphomicrobiales bacterium]MBO6737380.1 signal recognition particle-docking protein FtsY [Hyphomicrobiales bacterium]MBO6911546.1 signal recognition particle-docking protein FtsY [Hyphomicrobiales bacterium]MBO6955154.1 signal recognition particle-docking protein FtsY [Hyphomicrobiales bacterium]